ncbi:Dolichol-phosphate mannosyltransferase subunit 3 [Balamuthia mandrillaris]
MRKVIRWILYFLVAISGWGYFVRVIQPTLSLSYEYNLFFYLLPLTALVLFGLYSLARILINVATFPTCPDAAKELRKEMDEAERDLKRRGFKFGQTRTKAD